MKQGGDKGNGGFSLLEVVTAMAILGLVTVPLCAGLVLSVRVNNHAQALLEAQLAASAMVETLMSTGVDVTGGDFASLGDNRYEMTDRARPEGVARVEVVKAAAGDWYEVTVVGAAEGRTVELTTAVREKGGGP